MRRTKNNIVILENSQIIYEGLSNILLKSTHHFTVYRVDDFEDLKHLSATVDISVVIINPNFILNKQVEFAKIKSEITTSSWVGLVYNYFDEAIIKQFDSVISINEADATIIDKVYQSKSEAEKDSEDGEKLSERETGVLIELINGLSNKEVGDKLHISIHTVITHRKNIMEKTGIKSLSGLTIYAISKNIIQID